MAFYGTVAGADIYHADRANAGWTGDETAKTAALVRATDYINAFYFWNAFTAAQIEAGDTPLKIEQAAYEVALRELTAPGSLTPDYVATAQVTKETKQVGPLMKSLEYATSSGAASSRPRIALIDGMLRGLTGSVAGSANFAVNRA
jgi:hypothetical protein